jgi:hypothetical protein
MPVFLRLPPSRPCSSCSCPLSHSDSACSNPRRRRPRPCSRCRACAREVRRSSRPSSPLHICANQLCEGSAVPGLFSIDTRVALTPFLSTPATPHLSVKMSRLAARRARPRSPHYVPFPLPLTRTRTCRAHCTCHGRRMPAGPVLSGQEGSRRAASSTRFLSCSGFRTCRWHHVRTLIPCSFVRPLL